MTATEEALVGTTDDTGYAIDFLHTRSDAYEMFLVIERASLWRRLLESAPANGPKPELTELPTALSEKFSGADWFVKSTLDISDCPVALVARAYGRIVGAATAMVLPDKVAVIKFLEVDPACEVDGVRNDLYERLVTGLPTLGAQRIETFAANPEASQFFGRRGFTGPPQTKGAYATRGQGMTLELAAH